MATVLDIVVVPTGNSLTLAIADASTYDVTPDSATIIITPPGFNTISIPFTINSINVFSSSTLEITDIGATFLPLPDGIYHFKYEIAPAYANYIERDIMRIDQIQEKFDQAFMKLDMMECDKAIKNQAKVDLNSIYFFIQGSVAAANNCAIVEANKLYITADRMLNTFIRNNCGCTGNNYITNLG
jgi:hypothetical protein